jgi:hypothetical protein
MGWFCAEAYSLLYQLLKKNFGLDVLAGHSEFFGFKRTVSYLTLPMSFLGYSELFMREISNRQRSYIAYDINLTLQPLNKGPFHAALKALGLETNITKG